MCTWARVSLHHHISIPSQSPWLSLLYLQATKGAGTQLMCDVFSQTLVTPRPIQSFSSKVSSLLDLHSFHLSFLWPIKTQNGTQILIDVDNIDIILTFIYIYVYTQYTTNLSSIGISVCIYPPVCRELPYRRLCLRYQNDLSQINIFVTDESSKHRPGAVCLSDSGWHCAIKRALLFLYSIAFIFQPWSLSPAVLEG